MVLCLTTLASLNDICGVGYNYMPDHEVRINGFDWFEGGGSLVGVVSVMESAVKRSLSYLLWTIFSVCFWSTDCTTPHAAVRSFNPDWSAAIGK